jgi:uncharacterized protein (DUF1330 family)
MSAYVLAIYDIVNQEGYGPYVPAVLPLLQKYGVEARGRPLEVREGAGSRPYRLTNPSSLS